MSAYNLNPERSVLWSVGRPRVSGAHWPHLLFALMLVQPACLLSQQPPGPAGGLRAASDSGGVKPVEKVSPELLALHGEHARWLKSGGGKPFAPSSPLSRIVEGRVVIDAAASGEARALLSDLESLGLRKGAAFGRMVSGELPIEAIGELAGLASLRFARPAAARTNAASPASSH